MKEPHNGSLDEHAAQDLAPDLAQDDPSAGLLQHGPGRHYLHLLREVILTYRFMLRRLAREVGLSVAQVEVLRQIAVSAAGRSSVSTLSRELGMDPAAVTRTLADLERMGIVARETDEHDGRRRPVVFTAAGRRRALELHARLHAGEGSLFAALDDASIEVAAHVLQTVRATLVGTPPGMPPAAAGAGPDRPGRSTEREGSDEDD